MARRGPDTVLRKLIHSFGNECHYCGELCTGRGNSDRAPSKEHIVPKFFGGANSLDNYLLACRGCNNERQNTLFYCECMLCAPKIRAALDNQENIDYVFRRMATMGRTKVMRSSNSGRGQWAVRKDYQLYHFDSYKDAIEFAFSEHGYDRMKYGF